MWDAGKSSQIPRFLLEENMEPILCTQPRRLAVVAIARTVAKALDCEVGGDVGYHIGHSNVSDHNSKRYLHFFFFFESDMINYYLSDCLKAIDLRYSNLMLVKSDMQCLK